MKKILKNTTVLLLMLCATFCVACSKDSDDEVQPQNDDSANSGKVDSLGVKADRPTDWVVSCAVDPTTSMTITMQVKGLPYEVDENDLAAAFINGECRGVSKRIEYQNTNYFFLPVVRSLQDDADTKYEVVVRYYSSKAGRIYTMTPNLTYANDAYYGTPLEPETPTWQ